MKKLPFFITLSFVVISFILNFFALLKIFPILISSPLLFLSLFIFISSINNRRSFKGF
jgi:hypothetical protein